MGFTTPYFGDAVNSPIASSLHNMTLPVWDQNAIAPAIREGDLPHQAGLLSLLIPVFLLAIFAIQSLWFIGTQSLTVDEPAHLIAGVEAWQQGRFQSWNDHPPLGRLWLTLPLARAHVEFTRGPFPSEYELTGIKPGPEWIAWHTRPMNTLLGLTLGVTLWFAARRLFSEGAANAALALYAFTPSLIAHFSIMTT